MGEWPTHRSRAGRRNNHAHSPDLPKQVRARPVPWLKVDSRSLGFYLQTSICSPASYRHYLAPGMRSGTSVNHLDVLKLPVLVPSQNALQHCTCDYPARLHIHHRKRIGSMQRVGITRRDSFNSQNSAFGYEPLHLGAWNAPITCDLLVIDLDNVDEHKSYEAISYACLTTQIGKPLFATARPLLLRHPFSKHYVYSVLLRATNHVHFGQTIFA